MAIGAASCRAAASWWRLASRWIASSLDGSLVDCVLDGLRPGGLLPRWTASWRIASWWIAPALD